MGRELCGVLRGTVLLEGQNREASRVAKNETPLPERRYGEVSRIKEKVVTLLGAKNHEASRTAAY